MDKRTQNIFQTHVKDLSQIYLKIYTESALKIFNKNKSQEEFSKIFLDCYNEILRTHKLFIDTIANFEKKKQQEIENNPKLSVAKIGRQTQELVMTMQVAYDIAEAVKTSILNDLVDLLFYCLVYQSNNFKVVVDTEPPVFYLSYSARKSILKEMAKYDDNLSKISIEEIINSFDKKIRTYKTVSKHKIQIIQKKEEASMQTLSEIHESIKKLLKK